MKLLSTYYDNTAFNEVKENLDKTHDDYASLALLEHDIHIREKPYYADIALWDNTEETLLVIHGWECNVENYPIDRYMPIGVEAIPKEFLGDGHTRFISLVAMNFNTPKIGSNGILEMQFGLTNVDIEGIEYKTYVPSLTEGGSTDFGEIQEIKHWENMLDKHMTVIPSDGFSTLLNPFTKNQYYSFNKTDNIFYIPSPFTKFMNKNPIFFTENPDESNPSCLLNMDGKGETKKILDQLTVNIGNDDWKTGMTIENGSGITNAPAAQCTWMYCVKEGYETNPIFGQGCWYIPTIGEWCILMGYRQAINNSLYKIQTTYRMGVTNLGNISNSWSCSRVNNNNTCLMAHQHGTIYVYNKNSSARAMLLV